MITFTKEQLIARINQVTAINNYRISRDPDADGLEMDNELFAIALASLEAEAAGIVRHIELRGPEHPAGIHVSLYSRLDDGIELYTAPPATVSVPDERAVELLATDLMKRIDKITGERHSVATLSSLRVSIVDACRAAMLQGAEPVTTACKLPMQPLVIDAHGTLRFKENPIVRTLLDYATEHGYGLNEIAREEFDVEDQMQLAQLIGYSLSGYGTLSYVTDESYERAAAAAPQQEVKP